MAIVVGIDGCKAGWFCVSLDESGDWDVNVFRTTNDLWDEYKDSKLILIDIPIGLKEKGVEERTCDKMARKILGPKRGSSVFRVPCKSAVYADSYNEANFINKKNTTKGISKQGWGIVPKIKEMDALVLNNRVARNVIRESHPEVCFWALAGKPMGYRKSTKEGMHERMSVLESRLPVSQKIIDYSLSKYKRKDVKKDDILDSIVLAITAFMERIISIPEPAEFDERMLRMEIVYPEFKTFYKGNA